MKVRFIFYKEPVVGQPTFVDIERANLGKSPAIQCYTRAVTEIVRSNKSPSFTIKDRNVIRVDNVMMFPGDVNTSHIPMEREERASEGFHVYTSEEASDLISGRAYLAVFGYVGYSDQFGKHWTRFCDWHAYGPGDAFEARHCTLWNGVGDGETTE